MSYPKPKGICQCFCECDMELVDNRQKYCTECDGEHRKRIKYRVIHGMKKSELWKMI